MSVPQPLDLGKDVHVIKLAREVAIDHYPLNEVLDRYGVSTEDWEALQEWPRFQELLAYEKQQWHGALNTNQRVRLKSATLIEEFMEKGDAYLHDKETSFNSKIEFVKLLGKFAGLDAPVPTTGPAVGGRVTININMGSKEVAYDGQPDMIDITNYQEQDPDTIEFDWEAEFEANPVEGSMAIFEEA